MARVIDAVRFVGADLTFATWFDHLAARPTPARLIFLQPRREVAPTAQRGNRQIEMLDFAAWRARLSGAERRAA
jgi:hypothetical protein